jgi:hypothetical protein
MLLKQPNEMKNLRRYISSLVLSTAVIAGYSQPFKIQGEVNTSTIFNQNKQTPFWLWANTLGQCQQYSGIIQAGEFDLFADYNISKKMTFTAGARGFGTLGKDDYFHFSEYFSSLKVGKVIAQFGARADSLIHSGITSSNGSLLNSRNARPYPSIRLASDGYIKAAKKNFYIKGLWEETILHDGRVVKNPRLHHKNLFFLFGDKQKLQFEFGIDHYAFWGGISPDAGVQPHNFGDYLRTIFALRGNSTYTQSDQKNVAGNSLGQYFFIFKKDYPDFETEFRIVHPFEDFSGMGFVNGIDNLYALYITRKEAFALKNISFEFLYTKNQSGNDVKNGLYHHQNGTDNYLNHGMYRSGFTYFGKIMGSPFFYPVIFDENSVSQGLENNRIIALYLAGNGKLSKNLEWVLSGSYSWNYGTYWNAYNPVRKQLSALAKLTYSSAKQPFYITGAAGFDSGTLINSGKQKNDSGFQLMFGWKF